MFKGVSSTKFELCFTLSILSLTKTIRQKLKLQLQKSLHNQHMSSNRIREDKTLHLKTGNIIRKNIWYCGIWNEQRLWSSMQLIQVHKLWTWYSHQELSKFNASRYQFCQKEVGKKRQRNVSISQWYDAWTLMQATWINRQQLPHLGLPSSSSGFVSQNLNQHRELHVRWILLLSVTRISV